MMHYSLLTKVTRLFLRKRGWRVDFYTTGLVVGPGGIDVMKRQPHVASVITTPPVEPHFLSTQRSLNGRTIHLFAEKEFNKISQHLEMNASKMTTSNLVTVMYLSCKAGHSLSATQVHLITDALRLRKEKFNVMDVANSCYGLKSFGEFDAFLPKLVTLLASKIEESSEAFNSQVIGNALYGMQNLSDRSKEVRGLLLALCYRIEACRQEMSPRHVASAMYGLRRMDSRTWEVRRLVAVLARKVKECTGLFNGQEVGNCLYGLQNMSSRQKEVQTLVFFLCPKIDANREELTTQQISSALLGLRGLRSEHAETRRLLQVLCRKINSSSCCFDAQAVGNSLLGMRNMRSEHREVRRLLASLLQKLGACDQALSPLQLCSAVSGLRNMKSSEEIVRDVLMFLNLKWKEQQRHQKQQHTQFTLRGLCNALYGLRLMSCEDGHVKTLLSLLDVSFSDVVTSAEVRHNVHACDDVAHALNGLRGMNRDFVVARRIISHLTAVLLASELSVFQPRSLCLCVSSLGNMTGSSSVEKELFLAISMKSKHPNHSLVDDIHVSHEGNISFGSVNPPALEPSSTGSMTPVEISMCLCGLQGVDSDFVEVRGLLTSLLPFLWSSTATVERCDFFSMVTVLKNLKSEHVVVRSYLSYLSFVLIKSSGDYSSRRAVYQIITNLRHLDSRHVEVRHFLEMLTLKIQSSPKFLTGAPPLNSSTLLSDFPFLDKKCTQVIDLECALLQLHN